MSPVSQFIKTYKVLCFATLGLAIIGYMGYRLIRKILELTGKTKTIDQIALEALNPPQERTPNPHTLSAASKREETQKITDTAQKAGRFLHSQKRRYPPVSIDDTVIAKPGRSFKELIQNPEVSLNDIAESVHGQFNLFSDEEIVEKKPIIRQKPLIQGEKVYAEFTEHGKAIIQQQATRGCTAAVAAMLIIDNNKQPSIQELRSRNLGNDDDQERDIREAVLEPLTTEVHSLQELRQELLKNGSAIIGVDYQDSGGHVIVVDAVSEDSEQVRLRDPYHGWEITVTGTAFDKAWMGGGKIMQVKQT